MRGLEPIAAALLLAVAMSGCSGGPSKRTLASTEPALISPGDPDAVVVDRAKPVPSTASAADRHPLLAKPKQYYDDTNSNKLAKTAAATFIGVPAGIYGELKQIVVGVPASQSPAY
jgi:hypothetical protein